MGLALNGEVIDNPQTFSLSNDRSSPILLQWQQGLGRALDPRANGNSLSKLRRDGGEARVNEEREQREVEIERKEKET